MAEFAQLPMRTQTTAQEHSVELARQSSWTPLSGSNRRLMAVLLAAILFATACGGTSEEAGNSDEAAVPTGRLDEGATSSGGAEASSDAESEYLAASGQESSSDSARGEGNAADEATDEATEGATMSEASDGELSLAPATTIASDSGGFFGDAETQVEQDRESNVFKDYGVRSFIETDRDSLSTFALDVDTASYFIGREYLQDGQLPPPASVRVEEYVNSFDYDYSAPNDGLTMVSDAGPSPFDNDNVIVRIGVSAEQVSYDERAPANLTFVVDTSGSMDRSDRLGLVKVALTGLVRELDSRDTVAIVTYSDEGDVLLEPTSVRDIDEILDAIDNLRPGGSTNLEAGLAVGYDLASEAFQNDGINRVILASDGVANVGLTDPDGLVSQIREDADRGIQLVTVGVGMGNFNDVVMETLADDGDGFYAYVNDEHQAQKLFSDDLLTNLVTVAIDGKIQVDFDPKNVVAYRLLGFENRAVHDSDFRNDDVDAGELGSGHQMTALYELKLADNVTSSDRLGTAALRWEDPESGDVRESRLELSGAILVDKWERTDEDFRLAVTVATFAEILRKSQYAENLTLDEVLAEAEALSDRSAAVEEFKELVSEAVRAR